VAHKCRSSQYSNMRPRYVLGRTIPEAAGIAAAVVCGYLAFQLTSPLTYAGQAGKLHLLAIFAAVAVPIVVGFVFFMDNQEPYPRQVVGFLRRRTGALVRQGIVQARQGIGQARARVPRAAARGTVARATRPVRPAPALHSSEATDLTGRLIARLRRPRPVAPTTAVAEEAR